MKKSLSKFSQFNTKYRKYLNVIFFSSGFVWDWLTIDRIDNSTELIFLGIYFVLLTICKYFNYTHSTYNLKPKVKEYVSKYLPLVQQFFLGGLCSASVIYFSRSVSVSKTAVFFILIGLIFIIMEFFRKKLSVYLQFIMYAFVSFIFLACIMPVIFSAFNSFVFYFSGIVSLSITLLLIFLINRRLKNNFNSSYSKLLINVLAVYVIVVVFYIFKLIPPVPLALTQSKVAVEVNKKDLNYEITYQPENWFEFWKSNESNLKFLPNEKVFVYTSIFSPSKLNVKIYHRWSRLNTATNEWQITDKIGYNLVGGREKGFRGYTNKSQITDGQWKVEVITEQDIIIGIISFSVEIVPDAEDRKLKTTQF